MIVTASVARYFNWGCLCWIRRRNKVKSNKNIVCWQIVYTRKVRYEVHRQLPTSSEKLWCLAFENQWFVFLFVTWCDLRPCFRWTHLTSDPSGLCHVIIHHRITLSKATTKELVAVSAPPPHYDCCCYLFADATLMTTLPSTFQSSRCFLCDVSFQTFP